MLNIFRFTDPMILCKTLKDQERRTSMVKQHHEQGKWIQMDRTYRRYQGSRCSVELATSWWQSCLFLYWTTYRPNYITNLIYNYYIMYIFIILNVNKIESAWRNSALTIALFLGFYIHILGFKIIKCYSYQPNNYRSNDLMIYLMSKQYIFLTLYELS